MSAWTPGGSDRARRQRRQDKRSTTGSSWAGVQERPSSADTSILEMALSPAHPTPATVKGVRTCEWSAGTSIRDCVLITPYGSQPRWTQYPLGWPGAAVIDWSHLTLL